MSTTGVNDLTLSSGSGQINVGATSLVTTAGLSLDLSNAGNTVLAVTNSGTGTADLNIVEGALQTAGTTRLTNAGVLQNVTNANAGTFFTGGTLTVERGGTGVGSFTSNGVVYGNGTSGLQTTAAGTGGQVLMANGSGVPTFTTLSGDISVDNAGVVSIGANSVALGADTTGDYVAALGTLTGLQTTGNSGEGSTPTLSVIYGSGVNTSVEGDTEITVVAGAGLSGGNTIVLGSGGTATLNVVYGSAANTAVQGNTSLTCASGTGNLSGGGNTITLGTGGTCSNITISDAPVFNTSVTTPLLTNAGALTIQTTATAGADDIIFRTVGNEVMRILEAGDLLFEKGVNDVTVSFATPGAPATYTFSGATGTVLTTANFATNLDSTYVNVNESPAAGDISGSFQSGLTINPNSVALGTDTTGDYVQALGTLTGLSVTGNSGEGSTPGLSVLYGSGANTAVQGNTQITISAGTGLTGGSTITLGAGGTSTLNVAYGAAAGTAVQGNTTLVCPSGTGNLSGGGNTITLGAGGTCGALTTNAAVSFATSVTTPLLTNAGALTIQTTATAGADDIIFQTAGVERLRLNEAGQLQIATSGSTGGLVIGGDTNLYRLQEDVLRTDDTFIVAGGVGGVGIQATGGRIEVQRTLGNAGAFTASVVGDTVSRFAVTANGAITWSSGASVADTNLYRSGTGTLRTDGVFVAGSGLTVATGGASITGGLNNNSGGITNAGAISGATTLSLSGAITGATTTNTINGLIINSGALSGITTLTASGNINTTGGVIQTNSVTRLTNAGALENITTLNLSGAITGATVGNTINGLIINSGSLSGITGYSQTSGALAFSGGGNFSIDSAAFDVTAAGAVSGVTTLNLSGAITGATSTNTINGLIINGGALSGVTGLVFTSGNLNLANGGIINTGSIAGATTITASGDINTTGGGFQTNSVTRLTNAGALQNITTLNLSGAITGATASNTINGLVINSGALSGVTGITFTSGALNLNNGGITNTGSIAGATTITASGLVTGGGVTSNGALTVIGGDAVVQQTGTGAAMIINRTDGVIGSMKAGAAKVGYFFDESGSFSIARDSRANIASGTGAGVDVLSITGAGAITLHGSTSISSGGLSIIGGLNNNSGGITNVGAISGATTLNLSGAITGATTTNTINGLIINSGALSGITTLTASGNINTTGGAIQTNSVTRLTNAGALQNITTLNLSGAITGATATNTINGLVINSGALSGITGITFTSGALNLNNGGITNTGSIAGATTIVNSGIITSGGRINANAGLTIAAAQTLTVNGSAFTSLTGNGLAISGGELVVNPQTGGGLTVSASGLTIRRDCSNGQIVKWNGTAWNCAADNQGFSDIALKQNVANVGSVLDQMADVRVVTYNFKCLDPGLLSLKLDCDLHTGIISQEIEVLFPGSTIVNSQGYREVNFQALNFYTMRAVVELANMISANGTATLNSVSTGGVLRLNSAGALSNITGLNVISGGATIAGGLTVTGSTSVNNNALTATTSIGTGTTTGAVTIGSGLNTVAINSLGFKVNTAGAVSGVTTLGASGLITGANGLTISGGAINLNVGGLLTNTNINTGASTGTTTIGGGLSTLVINSTAFDVSATGAVSGVTTLSASNNISITGLAGVFQRNGQSGISAGPCGNTQYLGGLQVSGGIVVGADTCRGVGLSDERLKDNVVNLEANILDQIKNVRTVTFDFKCEDPAFQTMNEQCEEGQQTGVIAQELAQVFPDLVYQDEFGYYRVKYDALSIYNLRAVSELAKTVNSSGEVSATKLDVTGDVNIDGVLEVGTIRVQNIEGLDYQGRIDDLENQLATVEDRLTAVENNQNLNLDLNNITLGNVTATGDTSLQGLTINLDLVAQGAMTVHGKATFNEAVRFEQNVLLEGEINILGYANVQGLTVNLDLIVKGAMIVDGSATFKEAVRFEKDVVFEKDVAVKGQTTFNNDTAGLVTIEAGQTTVQVTFANEKARPPIIALTLGDGKFAQYSYRNVTETGFEVILATPALEDLTFSWVAIQTEEVAGVPTP